MPESEDEEDGGGKNYVVAEEEEEPVFPDPPELSLPQLPPDQERLVDEWWKETKRLYTKKTDGEELLRHLNVFWDEHPELIPHLGLEYEFMFELYAKLGRQEKCPLIVQPLMRLRAEHPATYEQSFGYFDRYLVIEALAQGRTEDLPRYFDFFHRYPTADRDNAVRIYERLAWAGAEAALLEFVKPIRQEPDGPGFSISPNWLYFGLKLPHLDAATHPDVATELVVKEVQDLNMPQLASQSPKWLRIWFDCAWQSFRLPDYDACRTCDAVQIYLNSVTWNFMGFLHRVKGLPWLRAYFLADRLWDCWTYRAREVRPKAPFGLNLVEFEDIVAQTSFIMFGHDDVLAATAVEAMALFADYLLICGYIEEPQRQELQDGCRTIYQKAMKCCEPHELVPRLKPQLTLE